MVLFRLTKFLLIIAHCKTIPEVHLFVISPICIRPLTNRPFFRNVFDFFIPEWVNRPILICGEFKYVNRDRQNAFINKLAYVCISSVSLTLKCTFFFKMSLHKFFNLPSPPPKKAKTDEERKDQQKEYDQERRKRSFQPSWSSTYSWLENDRLFVELKK